ncbi:MAG: alpha/beta hydrolase [Chthoniobacterales bacterium]
MNNNILSRLSIFGFGLISLATLNLSASQALARTDPEPTEYFATANDGTQLHWVVYTPTTSGPWPVVLLIHGGNFKGGGPTSSPQSIDCGRDLAAAGFIAFSIEYRLAPDGALAGQVSDGRFPDQSDDVRLAILAARQDARCNGQVGVVGGSAGGYFTALSAGTGTIGEDRIDVGVSLSGAYDFSDTTSDPNLAGFQDTVNNYVGTSDVDALKAASPVYLVDHATAPLFLINTENDTMPFSQLADMTARLDALGVTNYQALTLPGSQHSFSYWGLVKDQAIQFLADRFAGVPVPEPTAKPAATASPTPPPAVAPTPSKMLLNVSTRVHVQDGNGVMIGGFIISGAKPKKVILRGIGPSLAAAEVGDVLTDPVLEVYDAAGTLVAQNDNCSSLTADRFEPGFKPQDGHESYISTLLPEGSYTAVLRGVNGTAGVGLFELYDLDPASARIINISTRGEVGLGSDVMIGGFIIGGEEPAKVIVRAIGPSLAANNVPDALADPMLSLYNADGSLIFSNDNWRRAQEQQIVDSGVPPTDDREAAIVATLRPGGYTAMLSDAGDTGGVALVEIYNLETE